MPSDTAFFVLSIPFVPDKKNGLMIKWTGAGASNRRRDFRRPVRARAGLVAVAFVCMMPGAGRAQELEPRAYASSPTGMSAYLWVYGRSSGGVVFDPTLPLEDVTATINSTAVAFFKSFGFLGRMANASVSVPYTWGSTQGLLEGEFARGTRSGLADSRFRFTMNLVGAPALRPREFANYRQKTNFGVGFTLTAPTGQYDSTKLINLGTNRWTFKPEFGLSHARGRWLLAVAGGIRLFASNDNFLSGSVRKQDPIGSLQGHVTYHLPRRMWVGFNANYFRGGQAQVDGVDAGLALNNSRFGATFSIPLRRRHSIKLSYSNGVLTRTGTDFSTFGVAYQFVWLGLGR